LKRSECCSPIFCCLNRITEIENALGEVARYANQLVGPGKGKERKFDLISHSKL
jgi:hypothetical protein